MRTWEPILDQLYRHLEENDRHLELLRGIDHEILLRRKTPIEIIYNTIEELLALTEARTAHLFLRYQETYALNRSFGPTGDHFFPQDSQIRIGASELNDIENGAVLRRDDAPKLFRLFPESTRTLVCSFIELKRKKWGFCVFESLRLVQKASSDNYIKSATQQLSIAVSDRYNRERMERFKELHSAFFRKGLREGECLQILLDHTKQILKNHDVLLLQILFLDRLMEGTNGSGSHHDDVSLDEARFMIRFSTNAEEIGAFVPMNSFSGAAIKKGGAYLLDNPHSEEYSHIYKDFTEFRSQTELAIVIRKDEQSKAIGVFNIESPDEGAFTREEIESTVDLVELVSPIIAAIRSRNMMARVHRDAGHYALNNYLRNLTAIYAHKFESRIDTVKFNLDLIKKQTGSQQESFREDLESAIKDFSWIRSSLRQLWDDVAGIARVGPKNIGSIIDELCREEKYTAQAYLQIGEGLKELPPVKATQLLKEHIRNMILNAVRSIEKKQAESGDESYRPSIVISAFRRTIQQKRLAEEALESDDDVAAINWRVRIVIRDNGVGIQAENMERIFDPGFSTTGTSGFGLPAAREYARQLGGNLEIDSIEGEFCEVHLDLLIFVGEGDD